MQMTDALSKACAKVDQAKAQVENKLAGHNSSMNAKYAGEMLDKLVVEIDKNRAAIGAVEGGQDALASYDAFVARAKSDIEREKLVDADADVKKLRDPLYNKWYGVELRIELSFSFFRRYWFTGAHKDPRRIDLSRMKKYLDEMKQLYSGGKGGLPSGEAASAFTAFMDKSLGELEQLTAKFELADEASKIISSANSQKRWMESYQKRGDAANVSKYWEMLKKSAQTIVEDTRYHELDEVIFFSL